MSGDISRRNGHFAEAASRYDTAMSHASSAGDVAGQQGPSSRRQAKSDSSQEADLDWAAADTAGRALLGRGKAAACSGDVAHAKSAVNGVQTLPGVRAGHPLLCAAATILDAETARREAAGHAGPPDMAGILTWGSGVEGRGVLIGGQKPLQGAGGKGRAEGVRGRGKGRGRGRGRKAAAQSSPDGGGLSGDAEGGHLGETMAGPLLTAYNACRDAPLLAR